MSKMPTAKGVKVSIFLAAAALADPAAAQQVCEVNGGSHPSGSAATSADLACGGSASGFLDPNYPAFGATALGVNANADGGGALAVGHGAQAIGGYTVAIGGTGAAPTRATGTQAIAIGGAATASGFDSVALGMFANSSDFFAVSIGAESSAAGTGSIAVGGEATASGTNSIAVGLNATASASNSVALGANSVASSDNTVSVGSAGAERRITNVAPGTAGTDAVNLAQLESVASASATDMGAVNERLDELFAGRSSDRREMRSGVATAVAMANAPMPSAAGRTSYVVNGATFRGQQAVGVSMMHRFNTSNPFALGAGVSYAGGKNTAGRVSVAGEF